MATHAPPHAYRHSVRNANDHRMAHHCVAWPSDNAHPALCWRPTASLPLRAQAAPGPLDLLKPARPASEHDMDQRELWASEARPRRRHARQDPRAGRCPVTNDLLAGVTLTLL